MQVLRERIRDDAVVCSGGEQLLLRIPGEVGPDLQRSQSEQGGEAVLVHVR